MRHLMFGAAAFFCLLSGALLRAQDPNSEKVEIPHVLPIVKEVETTAVAEGRVAPGRSAALRSRVFGTVTKVMFPFGGNVKQGEVLLELDSRSFEATVRAKEAALHRSRAALQSSELLLQRAELARQASTGNAAEVDQARARLEESRALVAEAEAVLELARLDLEATRIVAPFDGRLTRSRVTEGEQVSPEREPFAVLSVLNPLTIEWSFSPGVWKQFLADVPGDPIGAEVTFAFVNAREAVRRAKILYVGDPGATARDRGIPLAALIENAEGSAPLGTAVEIRVPTGKRTVQLLPASVFESATGRPLDMRGDAESIGGTREGTFGPGGRVLTAEGGPRFQSQQAPLVRGARVSMVGLTDDGSRFQWSGYLNEKHGDLWSFSPELPEGQAVALDPSSIRLRLREGRVVPVVKPIDEAK